MRRTAIRVLGVLSGGTTAACLCLAPVVCGYPPGLMKGLAGLVGGLIVGLTSSDVRESVIAGFLMSLASAVLVALVLASPPILGVVKTLELINVFVMVAAQRALYDLVFVLPIGIASSIGSRLAKEWL
mgnify:CR=1 FL=1